MKGGNCLWQCLTVVLIVLSCACQFQTARVGGGNKLGEVKCKTNEFLCVGEGKCIHEAWFCDGDPDCADKSDETNCGEQVSQPEAAPIVTNVAEPPSPPTAYVTTVTSNSVLLRWNTNNDGGSPITGFTTNHKSEGDMIWEETKLSRGDSQYKLTGLNCGTRYLMYVTASNRIGIGSPSIIITAQTQGKLPVPPSQNRLVRAQPTTILLSLDSWEDGGCGNMNLSIEYKRSSDDYSWRVVTENVRPQSEPYVISDLIPGTPYNLRVTGRNPVGETEAEYDVATPPLTGAMIPLNAIPNSSDGGKLGKCGSTQFECAESKRCISKQRVCDGRKHCRDGSDELNCDQASRSRSLVSESKVGCKSGEFTCKDGKCIPGAWVCDGDSDCFDHTDETSCDGTQQQRREDPNPHKYHSHQNAGSSIPIPRPTTTTTTPPPTRPPPPTRSPHQTRAATMRPQTWYPIAAPIQLTDTDCPSPCGIFEVPDNCQQFVVCNFGRAQRLTCPQGLLFDRELATCNYNWQVNCPSASFSPQPERILGLERDWV